MACPVPTVGCSSLHAQTDTLTIVTGPHAVNLAIPPTPKLKAIEV